MTTLCFSPSIPATVERAIDAQLQCIELDFDVRILFAVESGSRAWGFPSPDSDYDVRFVYAHTADWYLSLVPGRDVIERPLIGDLDVNGWDIRKALNLLLKPNPVLLEWLSSPVRYRWNDEVCAKLIALSNRVTHGPACLHHYLHLSERQWNVYIDGRDTINLKKYLYVVRPALAIRWLRLQPGKPPPMNLQTLSDGLDLAPEFTAELASLLRLKSRSKELGEGQRIPVIDELISAELAWARETSPGDVDPLSQDLHREANDLFRAIVKIMRG